MERIKKVIAIVFALLIWQILAMVIHQNILLVTPLAVVKRLFTIWQEPGFFYSVWFSFYHIAAGFFVALIIGILCAFAAKRFSFIETLLWPWVTAVRAVPVASIVVICLIWLSARNLSVFISFLVVFPVIYQNTLEGLKNLDKDLEEMSKVFEMGKANYLRFVVFPQLKPFIYSACSLTCGMAWKAGVAAEIIGTPAGSIGKNIFLSKQALDTDDLLCWTLIIVLLSVGFEKLFMYVLRKVQHLGN